MKRSSTSDHDEQDRRILRLLKGLGSAESEYPSELFAARRAAFLAQAKGVTPVDTAGERETVKLLERLKPVQAPYPAELLAARRAAFLAQVEQLGARESAGELSAGEQTVVRLLGGLKSAPVDYPPAMLAARRSAFLRQAAGTRSPSLWDTLRLSIRRIFPFPATMPAAPVSGSRRLTLVLASLLLAVLIGSLLFSRAGPSLSPSPSQMAATGEMALTICLPEDPAPGCPYGELTPYGDLADSGNGTAQPAVSKDARPGDSGVHRASFVNDGRAGASWVSDSPYSWIKIDLGQVTAINTVSLQKGSPGSVDEDRLGQFVIAVALTDVYSDGDSSNDLLEYAQVFSSAEAGFSGTVSPTDTIRTSFPSTEARFVKITFEQAGAAIDEIGVFMVPPAESAGRWTSTPPDGLPTLTFTSSPVSTPWLTDLAPSGSTGVPRSTNTSVPRTTLTLPPAASSTPALLPAGTQTPSSTAIPADTSTPVPTDPLPPDTPTRLPTLPPPTSIPPTAVPPTVQLPTLSSAPIVVTGNEQTLTFTCSGNEVVIRGHANIVSLLGSCSSITVIGNGNLVFYESGTPVITDRGRDNVISRR